MSLLLHGVGVSRGIVIGQAWSIDHRSNPNSGHGTTVVVTEKHILPSALNAEIERFNQASIEARAQLSRLRDNIPAGTPTDIAAFIDTHLLMLTDSALSSAVHQRIKEQHCNAEWALQQQHDALVAVFNAMEDPYLRSRKDDVGHVVERIQRILQGLQGLSTTLTAPENKQPLILIAADIAPADAIGLQTQGVAAIVTEFGGPLSHTAILARSLGIPAIVGVRNARQLLQQQELLIIDGNVGSILASPDKQAISHYQTRQQTDANYRNGLDTLRQQPSVTSCGTEIQLRANIEMPEDLPELHEVGAAGIGLYRTEFLYMNRANLPDEHEQFIAYRTVLDNMGTMPVTIRTLDLGADKQVHDGRHHSSVTTNPALGLRAVRLCLKETKLFKPQLRALLRASAYGQLKVMIPMISTLKEIHTVRRLIKDTMAELDAEGIAYNPRLPVGIMIEVPAAALAADLLAAEVDFFSIGTNDLIQYTLAIDRIDDEVNYLYDPLHPSVLRLIHRTIQAGASQNIPVALCGEMASEPQYTRLLLGLGLREFSMHPATLLEVKHRINSSNLVMLESQCQNILNCADHRRIREMVAQLNH